MRRFGLAALVLVLALTGCIAPQDIHGGEGGRHPWTQAGHLRLGEPDEPDSLLLFYAHTAAADEVNNLLYAPVFRYDAKGEFVPELATEVPTYANHGISKDSKTITLHLRRGVVWADGVPLTARDLVFTYKLVMNDRTNVKIRSGWDDITSIDTPNATTAVVHLREPNADVIGSCFGGGGSAYPPLPEHLLANVTNLQRSAYATNPVGSGPFILKSWQHGASLTFVPNPRYWRGKPKLDELTWKVIPNVDTMLSQLQTHDIDVYDAVPESQIDRLKEILGVIVTHRLLANERHLTFNTARPHLSDVRVRLAIAQAVDWDRMNRQIYHGYNERATSDILPSSWAAPTIPFYKYDVAGAKRLLEAAGWKIGADGYRHRNGSRLTMEISSGTNKPANDQAEVQIQSQLKAVGIAVDVRNYPVNLLFARDGPLYSGKYDTSWTIDTFGPDPDNQGNWSGKFIPPNGANTSWIDDPVINETSAAQLRTFDRATRKALIQREEMRIHELVPAIFLYWENGYTAYNDDLKNFKPAQYIANSWNAWEWEI